MFENVPAKICSRLSEKKGDRLSQKVILAKKKKRTNRKSEEKEKKRREKSYGCTISFSLVLATLESMTEEVYFSDNVFKNPASYILVYQNEMYPLVSHGTRIPRNATAC